MTQKERQIEENTIVLQALEKYNETREADEFISSCRLRSCSADVLITAKYYILRSYNTIIAFIDRETDTLYDVLRYVYGYTATSAKHIAKFNTDYCASGWGCKNRYTYKVV